MILALIILVPLIIITLLIYSKSTPKHIDKRTRTIYNSVIFSISLIACFTVCLYTYFTTGQSVDRAWWPIFAVFGSVFVFTIVLIIGGLFRNFVIFRKSANE